MTPRHLASRLASLGVLLVGAAALLLWRDEPHFGDRPATATEQRRDGLSGLAWPALWAPRPTVLRDELGASDLSIYVPLQASPRSNAAISVFGRAGTGFCNAPTLDLGGADPLLSTTQWQDFAKDVLLAVLPLPAGRTAWDGDAPETAALLQTMAALPDVDSDADCPDPVAADLMVQDTSILRQLGTNVATQQSLPRGACRYQNWRIVSARLDLCPLRTAVLAAQPDAFDPSRHPEFPADRCGGAELRLVAQPFVASAQGYRSLDMAMHLFYRVDDPAAALGALRTLKGATTTALAGKSARGDQGVWYGGAKALLLPHPGLREEMDCGGHPLGDGGDAALGPVGRAWRAYLAAQAKASRLVKLTWMVSDNSGANWSFGLRVAQPQGAARAVRRLESYKVETFSLAQAAHGFPYTPLDTRLSTLDYLYRAGHTETEFTSPAAQQGLYELLVLANPDKTSFNSGGKLGASCASCHTRDSTERDLRARLQLTHAQLAALAGTVAVEPPMWPAFRTEIETRNTNNLRHFGYGPAMTFGVSRRSLAEAEALRTLVRDYFPPPVAAGEGEAPAGEPQRKAGIHLATTGGVPTWQQDIGPLLAVRCGYCHGFKRAPALDQEAVATAYACYLDSLVQKDALGAKHMPPGIDLPAAEKILVHAWAAAQSCARP